MLKPRPDVLDFLLTRRSRPAKTLVDPVPDRAALGLILAMGARSPDHGKLEPWRFIVLQRPALKRLADLVETRGAELQLAPETHQKAVAQFARAGLVVAVVAAPKAHAKVPEVEQILSAGAVCLAVLNGALASGWGANWLTGWMARDAVFLQDGLGLEPGEFIAGFIQIGSETRVPPERPRPDVTAITTWVEQ